MFSPLSSLCSLLYCLLLSLSGSLSGFHPQCRNYHPKIKKRGGSPTQTQLDFISNAEPLLLNDPPIKPSRCGIKGAKRSRDAQRPPSSRPCNASFSSSLRYLASSGFALLVYRLCWENSAALERLGLVMGKQRWGGVA